VVNTNDWLVFSAPTNGTGSATLNYSVLANPNPAWRTGVVQVADQFFTVSQQPVVCSYSLSPKSRSHGPAAASNSFTVTTSAGCSWTAGTTNGWITILSNATGLGNATVGYAVAINPNALERVGAITVADQSLIITQRAATCTFALSASSASHASGAGSGSVNVTTPTGCDWTVVNTNGWITVTTGTNGSGSGTVGSTWPPTEQAAPAPACSSSPG